MQANKNFDAFSEIPRIEIFYWYFGWCVNAIIATYLGNLSF